LLGVGEGAGAGLLGVDAGPPPPVGHTHAPTVHSRPP
jgi:hypothetical protein